MSVLILAEAIQGVVGKPSLEAISYGKDIAKALNTQAHVVVAGSIADTEFVRIANAGADKIHHVNDTRFDVFSSKAFAMLLAEVQPKIEAQIIVMSATFNGKALAPRVAAKLKAGLVTGAMELPVINGVFTVKKSVYSSKGFAITAINSPIKVITLAINSHVIHATGNQPVVENLSVNIPDNAWIAKIENVERQTGKVSLTEAEVVVSAGRGLKGPENWGMVEDLANILGAATACSKPVSDIGWRPHSEHVGQTGLTVNPNLYFALGISGAIQHLAGVSNSKVIVVVNKDPEAPFFKAADYGIVGDVFEVLPKFVEAAKKLKESH